MAKNELEYAKSIVRLGKNDLVETKYAQLILEELERLESIQQGKSQI